jgi:hypothetical protein
MKYFCTPSEYPSSKKTGKESITILKPFPDARHREHNTLLKIASVKNNRDMQRDDQAFFMKYRQKG